MYIELMLNNRYKSIFLLWIIYLHVIFIIDIPVCHFGIFVLIYLFSELIELRSIFSVKDTNNVALVFGLNNLLESLVIELSCDA